MTTLELQVTIGGVETRTLEVDGAGPTILLLHGFTDSADTWRPVLEELERAGRRAVAVDMPGHGKAGPLARPVLETLDQFVAAFVRAYAGDSPAILAGNSLGGLVALRAATDPGLPLAAVAGLGPAGLAHHRRLEIAARLVKILGPFLPLIGRLPLPPFALRYAAARFYAKRLMRGVDNLPLARYYAEHLGGMRAVARHQAVMNDLSQELGPEPIIGGVSPTRVIIALDEISVPVLLIWGKYDDLVDVAGAGPLLDAVEPSRLVWFEDCGHCPQLQRPDAVAQLLRDLPDSASEDTDTAAPITSVP